MSIRTQNSIAVGIIEQHEVAHQLVLIRRNAFSENAERRIAVAALVIPEHLIVSAVFFDDIHDVLEDARLADALRDRPSRLVWPRRKLRDLQLLAAIILPHYCGEFLQCSFAGNGNK